MQVLQADGKLRGVDDLAELLHRLELSCTAARCRW